MTKHQHLGERWYKPPHTFTASDRTCWKDGNGKLHPIDSMPNSHILNAMNYLEVSFFTHHTGRFSKDWDRLYTEIIKEYPIFEDLSLEAHHRSNPWKDNPTGRTQHCETLLEAYFVLKRQQEPPRFMVKEVDDTPKLITEET